MKYYYLFIFFILFFEVACNNQNNKDNSKIIDGKTTLINLQKDDSLYYSLAKVIDVKGIINLETNDSVIIKSVSKVIRINRNLYILDNRYSSVNVFDSVGKFLCKIGNLGTDSGHYIIITDIMYYPPRNTLWILCNEPKAILEFSLNGKYVRKIDLRNYATSMGFKNSNLIYFFANQNGSGKYSKCNLILTDSNNHIIDAFFKTPPNINGELGFTGSIFSTQDNKLYFNPPLTNSYYSLSNNGIATKSFEVSFKDSFPSQFQSFEDLVKKVKNYSYLGESFIANSKYLGFNYNSKNILKQAFYNIKTKHIALSNGTDTINKLFKNEIFVLNDSELVTPLYIPILKRILRKDSVFFINKFRGLYKSIMKKNDHDNPVLLKYQVNNF